MMTQALLGMCMLAGGCTMKPRYGPVPDGMMRKLQSQVRTTQEMGVRRAGGGVAFQAKVDGGPSVTLPLAVNAIVPTLQCWFNGGKKPVPVIFDTGAQVSVIDAETAVQTGIGIVDPTTTNITVLGVLGREKMIAGIISPLSFGSASLTKHLCLVRTHQNETLRLGPLMRERVKMDLIGFDLARQWCRYVTIDYPRHRLTFGFEEEFKPRAGPRVWKIPLVMMGGMPHIVLESRGVRWLALVDTGSAFGVDIDESLAAELGVLKGAKPVPPGSVNTAIGGMKDVKDSGVKLAALKELEGLGATHKNAEVAISPGGPRVGSYFFQHYKVTIDLTRQTLWLER